MAIFTPLCICICTFLLHLDLFCNLPPSFVFMFNNGHIYYHMCLHKNTPLYCVLICFVTYLHRLCSYLIITSIVLFTPLCTPIYACILFCLILICFVILSFSINQYRNVYFNLCFCPPISRLFSFKWNIFCFCIFIYS